MVIIRAKVCRCHALAPAPMSARPCVDRFNGLCNLSSAAGSTPPVLEMTYLLNSLEHEWINRSPGFETVVKSVKLRRVVRFDGPCTPTAPAQVSSLIPHALLGKWPRRLLAHLISLWNRLPAQKDAICSGCLKYASQNRLARTFRFNLSPRGYATRWSMKENQS